MKLMKYMSWLLLAMTVSVGLASCGNDDDDDDDKGLTGGQSELVGKWEDSDWGVELKSDHTGYGWDSYEKGTVDDIWDITWTYNGNVLSLIYDDGEVDAIVIKRIVNDNVMFYQWLGGSGDDEIQTMKKVRKFSWE